MKKVLTLNLFIELGVGCQYGNADKVMEGPPLYRRILLFSVHPVTHPNQVII